MDNGMDGMLDTQAQPGAEMPFSLEAEQSVLGAILLEPSCLSTVVDLLPGPQYFYAVNNRMIYGAMLDMFTLGLPVDFVTVLEQLKENRNFDEATGKVAWTRPAFGGNLMATILCPFTFPQIGTCRPGVNKKLEADYSRTAEVEKVDFVFPADKIRIKLIETIAEEGEKVDLEGAEIIVSGGRGLGGPEGFETTIKPLADALGGVVGSSRAAVDAGWIPHSHQVGQTGKTVGPKLYVACGISGAIQHLAGMGSSDFIVCINKDPEAPIFGVADLGVIGNLYDVCPALTKLILADKD